MNNRRIWFRLGGVLAAAAVCTGGAAVVSERAQEAGSGNTSLFVTGPFLGICNSSFVMNHSRIVLIS